MLTMRIAPPTASTPPSAQLTVAITSGEMPWAAVARRLSATALRSRDRSELRRYITVSADGHDHGDGEDQQPVDADADVVEEHVDAVDRQQLRDQVRLVTPELVAEREAAP